MENNHRFRTPAARRVQRSIQYGRPAHTPSLQHTPASEVAEPQPIAPAAKTKEFTFQLRTPKFIKTKLIRPVKRGIYKLTTTYLNAGKRRRALMLAVLAAVILSILFPSLESLIDHKTYALSPGEEAVLLETNKSMANLLTYDAKKGVYEFNQQYSPTLQVGEVKAGGARIKAMIDEDPAKGVTVTDPLNNADFTIKPEFDLGSGKQQENRVVFPAFNGGGHLVYTAGAVGVKQDVTLDHYIGDELKYDYKLGLDDGYVARLMPNGDVGIYGISLPLNGNVSTGSAKDAELLKKARQKAPKDKLLFALPAPSIKEARGLTSDVKAQYRLTGDKLTVVVENLKQAHYPLSIDPTVTAALSRGQFGFDANIETNVYIDDTNGLIKRSPLTGGNLNAWSTSNGTSITGTLNAAHFLGSAGVYGGTIYVIGGTSTTTTTNLTGTYYVEQAKINSDGTVQNFTAGNSVGLPAGGVSRFQLLIYNGYMYIVDGSKTDSTGASIHDDVYYTRITSESYSAYSNGAQLSDWQHTGSATGPNAGTPRYAYGATVYNGYIYIAGGKTGSAVTTGVSTVYYSQLLPSGAPGSWTLSSNSLPANRYDFDMQAYNGHLYAVGGNLGAASGGGALTETVYYTSIDSSNGLISAWLQTSSLVNADGSSSPTPVNENFGATFTMIYNGYLYVTGGCKTVSATGQCNTSGDVLNYPQLAQINADGSLGTFFPNNNSSTLARTGTATLGYNGTLYSFGGCSIMSSSAYSCSTTATTTSYALVNQVTIGDISNNRTPTALPTALMAQGSVVLNGFLYIIGGCKQVDCTSTRPMQYKTSFALLGSDGGIVTSGVASCPGGAATWCTMGNNNDNTALHFDGEGGNTNCDANSLLNNADFCGLAGGVAMAYNGMIYYVGGTDGNAYNNAVYYMTPTAGTGLIAAWTKGANTFPVSNGTGAVVISGFAYNGSLYVMGGCNNSTGIGCPTGTATAFQTEVTRSTLNSSGVPGTWTPLTGAGHQLQLTTGIGGMAVAVYGNYVYLAGGITNAVGETAQVLRAKINSSGDIVDATTGGAVAGTDSWRATTGSMAKARRRAAAVAVNGYLYVIGGHNSCDPSCGGNGTTYGDVQIGQIDMSSGGTGDINSFTTSTAGTVTPRWNPALSLANGFIYVTGGCTAGPPAGGCTTLGTTNESFVVYNANNLGTNTWNSRTGNSTNRVGGGVAMYNGYLYVGGGCTTFTIATLACSAVTTDVSYAPINADGSIGTWSSNAAYALPAGRAFGQLVAQNGYLYYMGGQNTGLANAVSTAYKSAIGASGLPGAFSATTASMPVGAGIGLTQFAAVTYAGRIFIAGGNTGTGGGNVATVYYSNVTSGDITSFTSTTSFTVSARRELSLVSAGAFLYIIGGFDGTSYFPDVQMATPNTSTGAIASWTTIKEIPYKQAGVTAFGANGYIYVVGGRNGVASTSCTSSVSFASVNQNGTVGEWQQPPNKLGTARFGAGGAFYNGYMYSIGGHNCTNIIDGTGGTRIAEQSGQLSEAIHATYSRYVDFGADATLRQLHVLGTNAQISSVDIDLWKIIVKTSTSVNNAWGSKYTTSLTGLATGPNYSTPITFQALDGSGVDQGVARYWDITFDIDQAQSFNFPDTTQPSITLYDFYFSPGPSKRLRLGKTFVNETQTNLDAHP